MVDTCTNTVYVFANLPQYVNGYELVSGNEVGLSGACYTLQSKIKYISSGTTAEYPCSYICPSPQSTSGATPTPTPTITRTPTVTPSVTGTQAATPTVTATVTKTATVTVTNTITRTQTSTPTVTSTTGATPTPTLSNTMTNTPTITKTAGPFPVTPSNTPTTSVTPTLSPTGQFKDVLASGSCEVSGIIVVNVPDYVLVGEIITVEIPYQGYVVNQCYQVIQEIPAGATLFGETTNYSSVQECISDNNPCASILPSLTPSVTTTATPTTTPTNTTTPTLTSSFRRAAFLELCCPTSGTSEIVYFNISQNILSGVFFYDGLCYTLIPDPSGQYSATTDTTLPYLTDYYDSCYECTTSNPVICGTPPVTATNTLTPTVTPTHTVTKTLNVTPTPSFTQTQTGTKLVTPTPSASGGLINIRLSGVCSGDIYDALSTVPIFFGQAGVFNGECSSVIGIGIGNGTEVFTATYLTGDNISIGIICEICIYSYILVAR